MADLHQKPLELETMVAPPQKRWWIWITVIQALILTAVMAFHYQHMLYRLFYIWSNSGDWSHGFIIPLFSVYYLYLQRDRMPGKSLDREMTARIVGALLLTMAFAIYVGGIIYGIEYPKNLSLIASIMGVVLMVCGWPIARWSWFAIAFLVFAMPLPQRIYQQMTMPFQQVAANISAAVLTLVLSPDMLAEAWGTVVEYIYKGVTGTLNIERACGGMRLMMTMVALGVAMAFIHQRPLWQRLIMILACIPIAIFCNIIRVTTTGFFVVFGKQELARGFWHMMLGLGMLFIAFSLYGAISYVLNHIFVEQEYLPDDPQTTTAEEERP
ncbi:MAG: exosortase/archaeosortase family protein [Planctomycetota bacterium]|nr:MAG: exosortase/archaeosortase family protein [Planctomycetota bacterium]